MRHHISEFGDRLAVAFSGGKDSLVALYLVLQQKPDVDVVFNNTGVEYPETRKFIIWLADQLNLRLTITKPVKSFWECISQFGWPNESKGGTSKKSKAHCCYYLKERPMQLSIREHRWLGLITGMLAIESRHRMLTAKGKGPCFHYKQWNICKIHPILWWTEEEVWQFIREQGLPYNPLYDQGMPRVGCMPCTAFSGWEAQMSKMKPELYKLVKLKKDSQYIFPQLFEAVLQKGVL